MEQAWITSIVLTLLFIADVDIIISPKLRNQWLDIVRGMHIGMPLKNFPLVLITILAGSTLKKIPIFRWSLLSEGVNSAPFGNWLTGIFFILLLIVALPNLAYIEEQIFRRGTKGWYGATIRSALFGLTHVLAGTSVAYGIALFIPGMWFTRQYFLGGISNSAKYHLAWNAVVFLYVGVKALLR